MALETTRISGSPDQTLYPGSDDCLLIVFVCLFTCVPRCWEDHPDICADWFVPTNRWEGHGSRVQPHDRGGWSGVGLVLVGRVKWVGWVKGGASGVGWNKRWVGQVV